MCFVEVDFAVVTTLFFLMTFWQLPHFYAYLWQVRKDYQQAGFTMLPYATPNGLSLMKSLVVLGAFVTTLCTAIISIVSPALTIITGSLATGGALYLSIHALSFAATPNLKSARRLFRSTIYFIAYFTCVAGLTYL